MNQPKGQSKKFNPNIFLITGFVDARKGDICILKKDYIYNTYSIIIRVI